MISRHKGKEKEPKYFMTKAFSWIDYMADRFVSLSYHYDLIILNCYQMYTYMHATNVLFETSSNLLGPLRDGGGLLTSNASNIACIIFVRQLTVIVNILEQL